MTEHRPRILVVDDDLPILLLMKNILTEFRFEAKTASSGLEAMQSLRFEKPDLILLDLNMPGMKGDQVLREIRLEEGMETVPVLILSGEPVSRETLEELGATGAVIKPFDLQELLGTIRSLVGDGSAV